MPPSQVNSAIADAGMILGVLVAAATLATILWVWIGRPMWKEWREQLAFKRTFRSDWRGEPGRDGVPPRPGVMARLADMGSDWSTLNNKVLRIEKDLLKVRSQVSFLLTHRCPEHSGAVPPPEDEEG